MDTVCARHGCKRHATHGLKIMIPARGFSFNDHPALIVYVRLLLCHRHAARASLHDMMPEAERQRVLEATSGAFPPDFERAVLRTVRLDGVEWAQQERVNATVQ